MDYVLRVSTLVHLLLTYDLPVISLWDNFPTFLIFYAKTVATSIRNPQKNGAIDIVPQQKNV